ncbi:hypothetical protein D3C77_756860 [compost metagenome]
MECLRASSIAYEIWGTHVHLEQKISYKFNHLSDLTNQEATQEIIVSFRRKFGEEVIEDLPEIVDHMVMMLDRLHI